VSSRRRGSDQEGYRPAEAAAGAETGWPLRLSWLWPGLARTRVVRRAWGAGPAAQESALLGSQDVWRVYAPGLQSTAMRYGAYVPPAQAGCNAQYDNQQGTLALPACNGRGNRVKTKLPSHAEWTVSDDMKFLRRYELLLKKAPPAALIRLDAYMLDARLRACGEAGVQ
jgi:hypothetical protein